MSIQIPLETVVEKLKCEVVHKGKHDHFGFVVASGLMSDVLTKEEEEILLVSNLTTSQVVRTADMVGAYGILITDAKKITVDSSNLARELGITLLKTDYPFFEACYRLGKLFFQE